MHTKYNPNRWLRMLDMAGMVSAPLSLSMPFFFLAVQTFPLASSNSKDYIAIVIGISAGLWIIICFVIFLGKDYKSYIYHQATRDEVMEIRLINIFFLIAGLIFDIIFFFLIL